MKLISKKLKFKVILIQLFIEKMIMFIKIKFVQRRANGIKTLTYENSI